MIKKILIILFICILIYFNLNIVCIENFQELNKDELLLKENRKFPFRYFQDENNNVLPIVAVTAFFRSNEDKLRYLNYIKNGINIIGVTAYKTFPKKITDDAEDKYHLSDDFNYTKNIKIWLTCMKNLDLYNFNSDNIALEMSESDFYDIDDNNTTEKKYDFIYICNKDNDSCPLNGWNAINRNYDLALKCFPIMINEFKLKGLCVGRIGCNLEKLYGDNIEVTDFLDYHVLQQKMRESKFLFVPNIYDASPRVISECLVKNVPVLMNRNIVCGFKYINNKTGELFTDEHDIKESLQNLLNNINNISPQKWWINNYGVENSSIKLRNFLYPYYSDLLNNVKKISFII